MSQDKTERMEYFINLLDDYIDGKLSSGQTGEIERALEQDPFLKEVLKQHVQARANMRVAGEEELKKKFADGFDPIPEVIQPKFNLLKILLPIILLLGLAGAAYFYFSNQEETQESRQVYAYEEESSSRMLLASVEDPSYDLLRSQKDTLVADKWQQAVQYFISQEYIEADSILITLETDTSFIKDHIGKFSLMKGVANLKMKEHNAAAKALSQITSENPYFDQAQWYLALTYFYAEDKEKAKVQLENIVKDKSHYRQGQAKTYLDKLSE